MTDEPDTQASEHGADADTSAELAWSQYDDTEVMQRRSWTRTVGLATGIVACGSVLAAGLWFGITGFRSAPANHVARPTVSAVPSTVTQTVSAAPAPPAPPVAAPTTPATTTAQASDAANDQLFLQRLQTDGFNNNSPEMAGFAHQVCNSLRQGQPEAQVVQWLAAALGMHQQWAALFVNDVKVSYPNCGTHTDNF